MQGARDLYDSFIKRTQPEPTAFDQTGTAISGLGVLGGLGMSGNSLYDLHNLKNNANNPVAVTYGYVRGKGGGHANMAKEYSKILNAAGINAEPVTHGWMPVRASRYSAVLPAGYGPNISKNVPRFSIPTDYERKSSKPLPFVDINSLGATSPDMRAAAVADLAKKYGFGDETKHIITLSGGETGSALERKLQALLQATSGRKDTAVIALAANAPPEVQEALSKLGEGRVRVVGSLPKNDFLNHLSSSSLNIGYGGSSSITEQLGMRNPQLNLFIDRKLNPTNSINLDFAKRMGDIDAVGVNDVENLRTRIDDILDNSRLYSRDSKVDDYLRVAKDSRASFINRINKLRGAALNARKLPALRAAGGGLGLAALGGLGLNYFMNKQSAFGQDFNNNNSGGSIKNLVGGAALGAGALLLPSAAPMLRAAARGQLGKLHANKNLPSWLRNFAGNNKGNAADFIADYTESARRMGDLPGVRTMIDRLYDYKSKYIPVAAGKPSHDFDRSHFKRFMSGSNREGMKHWAWEVGEDFKNRRIPQLAREKGLSVDDYMKLPEDARPYHLTGAHKRLERGRQAVLNTAGSVYDDKGNLIKIPGGLFDDAVHKGMSEYEAIKSLGKSKDPLVSSFLNALAVHKAKAAEGYALKALLSPGLAAGGIGLMAYQQPQPQPLGFIDKLRSSFSA